MDENFGNELMKFLQFTWRTAIFTARTSAKVHRAMSSLRQKSSSSYERLADAQNEASRYGTNGKHDADKAHKARVIK